MILVTGPTGSRQDQHALRVPDAHRLRSPQRRQPVDDRGSDRIHDAAGQPGAGQPGRRAWTSRPACARCCGRIRTSSWSARSATARPPTPPTRAALVGRLLFSSLHTNDSTRRRRAHARHGRRALPAGLDAGRGRRPAPGAAAVRVVPRELQAGRARDRGAPLARPTSPTCGRGLREYGVISAVARTGSTRSASSASTGCTDCRTPATAAASASSRSSRSPTRVRPLIMEQKDNSILRQAAIAAGMRTMFMDGVAKAVMGETSLEEVFRAAVLIRSNRPSALQRRLSTASERWSDCTLAGKPARVRRTAVSISTRSASRPAEPGPRAALGRRRARHLPQRRERLRRAARPRARPPRSRHRRRPDAGDRLRARRSRPAARGCSDRTHGLQFQAAWLRTAAPTSLEGHREVPGLRAAEGHRPALRQAAGRGVRRRGLRRHRARRRIGSATSRASARSGRTRISDGWRSQRAVRDIMVFLHGHGVGTSRALRIYKTYGVDAIPILRDNPYRLARDIRGIGFVVADKMAGASSASPTTAMIRVRAGVGYALAEGDGRRPLRPARGRPGRRRRRRCSRCRPRSSSEALALELADRRRRPRSPSADDTLRRSSPACTPPNGPSREHLRRARRRRAAVAGDRRRQGAGRGPAAQHGMTLADEQQRRGARWRCVEGAGAHRRARRRQDHACCRRILQILTAKRVRPLLCAPTGRAAKRLAEVDRPRSADDPSPARSEPARRPLPPRRAHAARRAISSSSTRRRWSTCR